MPVSGYAVSGRLAAGGTSTAGTSVPSPIGSDLDALALGQHGLSPTAQPVGERDPALALARHPHARRWRCVVVADVLLATKKNARSAPVDVGPISTRRVSSACQSAIRTGSKPCFVERRDRGPAGAPSAPPSARASPGRLRPAAAAWRAPPPPPPERGPPSARSPRRCRAAPRSPGRRECAKAIAPARGRRVPHRMCRHRPASVLARAGRSQADPRRTSERPGSRSGR